MGRTIVVTAGKGGVGKTTVTANLGALLTKLGNKVVVVDMDIGLRNLDVVMGLENRVVYNIMDVSDGKCKINQALVRDKTLPGLFLLPASQIHTKKDINIDKIVEIISIIENSFDYILLDSPAGIEKGFESASAPAKEALIVVTPDVSSVRDADRVIGILENRGILAISLIVNRYDINLVNRKKMLNADSVVDILGLDLIGMIPEDKSVIESTNKGELLVNYANGSPANKAFENISRRIEGEDVPFLNFNSQRRGIFSLFRRR
ncbi:MAG: septum site-determining protein MinD [Caldiserica bacterium CG02_land_8_20_14_3_00_36_38]|jgi:septum site-determining protein MinD|nr:septum site-determining protein MinD [Caldisericota bacterium]OIP12412.1 MAG: septum site-determining protein MinD [Caldisericum sp. CG2_30_36_11]PIP49689.1 MAG: septum site-determining protein MinD [Caldiserica bacterium CG23_combo_of_CG06-09_8_20_14_all_35_60]PIV55483.1 MAG: septum site-determining protein MinD [Caldiserica bacterium CG02_land_8_20_14_3_00_36_38]PIX29688.1 MAG: septum site-determining protein MinD [Caldiserica bacterium CG_4_8_14_3_um_filter_35_18]